MSRRYKFHNPDGVYFITFATEGWTDVFTHNEYKNILIDNLKYCQQKRCYAPLYLNAETSATNERVLRTKMQ